MLPSVNSLNSQILAIKPNNSRITPANDLATVIVNFMNLVQAGPTGSPGILTVSQPVLATQLDTQRPVADNSWIPNFANAWEAAVIAGTIVPGTAMNPAWVGSGNLDISTSSSPSTTIVNLAAAKATLISGLSSVSASNNPAMPLAQAIFNATSSFIFLCIGLGPPPTFIPTPIPISAQ